MSYIRSINVLYPGGIPFFFFFSRYFVFSLTCLSLTINLWQVLRLHFSKFWEMFIKKMVPVLLKKDSTTFC